MRFLLPIVGAVFSIALVSVAIAWVETGSLDGLFFEPSTGRPGAPVWKSLLAATVMILGVYCGCVHSQLRSTSSPIDIVNELGKAGRRSDFWRGLFASPVLFVVVYVSLEEQPGLVLGLLFAFENGFFCDKIFER